MAEDTGTPFVVYSGGFVVMPNETVNDKRLSMRARGVLQWMLGRPRGWRFSCERIAKESPSEGREAISTAVRELETCGYVRRSRRRGANGQITTVTECAALPSLMPPLPGAPETGQPSPVQPGPAQPRPMSVLVEANTEKSERQAAAPQRRGEVPEDWTPSAEGVAYATSRGMAEAAVPGEVERFVLYHRSKGNTFRRVELAWQTWVRNWHSRQPPAPANGQRRKKIGAWQ